jgi:uncharacterized protein (DUF849 family)
MHSKGAPDRPFIVNIAPTGAVADATKNPHVPLTPERIASDVAAAALAGASIAHLHVRNPDGSPSCDPALFERTLRAIRSVPACADLVLVVTTSGRHGQTTSQRTEVLELQGAARPDMASLTLGSVDFRTGKSVNEPDTVRILLDRMNAAGIKPELEVFALSMIDFAKVLIAEGRLQPPYYFNIFLSEAGELQADEQHVRFALEQLPPDSIVSLAGIGRLQETATTLGAARADGARIGLEDNLWMDSSHTPATNDALVRRIVAVARAIGRSIAAPAWTRERLGLARAHRT